jgi:hypothetical protein
MLFITKYKVQSRRGAGIGWTMGYVEAGTIFESNQQKNKWIQFRTVQWIPATACQVYDEPPNEPPDNPNNASIWWTISGEKPRGYKPDTINIGSFAIMWLLPEEPENIIHKPFGFNLLPDHIAYILYLNPGNPKVTNWLISQTGTDKVLSVNGNGKYRCPVPCCVEANPVNVLEWGERAVRIETVSIYEPLPKTLPDYLCHTWYGYKGKKLYKIRAEEGGIRYPLYARSNSAWIQRSGIQLNKPSLP